MLCDFMKYYQINHFNFTTHAYIWRTRLYLYKKLSTTTYSYQVIYIINGVINMGDRRDNKTWSNNLQVGLFTANEDQWFRNVVVFQNVLAF